MARKPYLIFTLKLWQPTSIEVLICNYLYQTDDENFNLWDISTLFQLKFRQLYGTSVELIISDRLGFTNLFISTIGISSYRCTSSIYTIQTNETLHFCLRTINGVLHRPHVL